MAVPEADHLESHELGTNFREDNRPWVHFEAPLRLWTGDVGRQRGCQHRQSLSPLAEEYTAGLDGIGTSRPGSDVIEHGRDAADLAVTTIDGDEIAASGLDHTLTSRTPVPKNAESPAIGSVTHRSLR